MNDNAAISLSMSVFFAALVGVSIYFQRAKGRKKGSILEFQRGLRFCSGKFVGLLEPGTYTIGKNENVVLVDMRPTSISFERLPVTTSDGASLAASVSGKIQVTDPRLAVSKSKNFAQDAAVTLRDALKRFINSVSESELRSNRAGVEKKILADVDNRLPGIHFVSLEIVELTLSPQGEKSAGFAAGRQ